MKKHRTIASTAMFGWALFSVAASVCAQSEVSSDAIGYYRKTLLPGFQSVSVSLVHNPVFASKIASSTSGTITSTYGGANFASLLTSGTEYYAEVTRGPGGVSDPLVGHRFEVNESASIAGANNVLVLDTASAFSTIATVPDLTDHYFEVRSHLTLNEVFDKNLLAGGASLGASDQLFVYRNGSYDSYFILSLGGVKDWRLFGGGNVSQDKKPLYPGQGILFNRKAGGAAVEIVVRGKVRANPFMQPLASGYSLLSEGYPVSASPRDRGAAPGTFTGATAANGADQVAIFNGSNYDTYYLFKIGTNIAWKKIGSSATFTDTDIFDYRGSVFMRRVTADSGYRVPLQWSP